MPILSKDPNVKELSTTTALSQAKKDFLLDLRGKVANDDSDRGNWKNKMIIATNQRLGIKRISNVPYDGAPDIPLPETDKLIKKSLPNLVLSAWAPKSICVVAIKAGVAETPELEAKRSKAETAMNMVLRSTDLGWFKKLMLAADNLKHFGHCIFKTYEEFTSRIVHKTINLKDYPEDIIKTIKAMNKAELTTFLADRYALDPEDEDEKTTIDDIVDQLKSGEEILDFDVEVVKSVPQVDVVLPTKIIVPAYTQDINDATRITYEYFMTKERLEALMESEVFLERDLDEISVESNDSDLLEKQKQVNEGLTDNTSSKELYRVHEICCYYKGKDKRSKKMVYTFLADVSNVETGLLQEIEFPHEFDGWFYDKHDNEIKDKRYFASRGVPEQIRALQEIIERGINNMLIRDELNNAPIWEVLDNSEIMQSQAGMSPGQKVPVKQLGAEIKKLNDAVSVDVSSERVMQIAKAYIEEYLSVSDQLFRNSTNQGGGKTLGEIQVGIQQNSGPLDLEVISWNDTLSKVYSKVFQIMADRLGDSISVGGMEVTKEDFNFPAEVRSNGSVEVSNNLLATQKAMARVQFLLNPALQDLCTSDDRYQAVKDWLEKDGVKDPDLFITDPKEVAQQQIVQMQGQLKQMAQQLSDQAKKSPSESISFKDLPPEGKTQMAAQAGIKINPVSFAMHDIMSKAKPQDLLASTGGQ
jgi:hypothetical protein